MKTPASKKQLSQNRDTPSRSFPKFLEVFVVVVAAIALFYALYKAGGGPQFSDELWYMQLGLNRIKDGVLINRYFHVFLQSFFMQIANTPLGGARLFWSAEMTFTMVLIYLSARYFNEKNRVLHATVSVLFFLSLSFFQTHLGDTIVDISAMMMVTLFFTLYLFSFKSTKWANVLLVGLGAVYFLAFKTKETTLVMGFVLIGFGFTDTGQFQWKTLWHRLRIFLLGVIAGIALFILLNAIILKDPWFGIRFSDIQVSVQHYGFLLGSGNVLNSDYLTVVIVENLVLFLLYLVSGLRTMKQTPNHQKPLWFYPLLLLASIILVVVRSKYEVLRRIYFPALPLLCILASQFLEVEWPIIAKERRKTVILYALMAAAVGAGFFSLPLLASTLGWEYPAFSAIVVSALVLLVLLGLLLLFQRFSHRTFIFPVLLLAVLLAIPIRANVYSMAVEKPVEKAVELRFYPFSQFKKQIQFDSDMQLVVSTSLIKTKYMLSHNIDDLLSMFNIYFRTGATRENFKYAATLQQIKDDALTESPQYLVMTTDDWNTIIRDGAAQTQIESLYQVLPDENNLLILLIRN